MKKLIILLALIGIILFFPLKVGQSTCLFGYWTGICSYEHADHAHHHGSQMLNNYMKNFAVLWWGSIALAVYIFYHWKKMRKGKQDVS